MERTFSSTSKMCPVWSYKYGQLQCRPSSRHRSQRPACHGLSKGELFPESSFRRARCSAAQVSQAETERAKIGPGQLPCDPEQRRHKELDRILLLPKAELWNLPWPMTQMRKPLADSSRTAPACSCYPSHPFKENLPAGLSGAARAALLNLSAGLDCGRMARCDYDAQVR
jgi:hypothetical protein